MVSVMDPLKKVLVVDDDEGVRVLCSEALLLAGYSVDNAINGEQALNLLTDFNYDLVVSDINMPVLDGITLYQTVVERIPGLKERFIFITGSRSREVMAALENMNRRYLIKPFKVSHLVDMADEMMRCDSPQ